MSQLKGHYTGLIRKIINKYKRGIGHGEFL